MKKLLLFLLLLLISLGAYFTYKFMYQPYDADIALTSVPTFTEVPINFTHEYKQQHALPFLGSAVIDLDNDNKPEIFLGGGHLQRDSLLRYDSGHFTDISAESGLGKDHNDSTYGAATIDIDYNGYTDLFVARDSGLYLYKNNNGFLVKEALNITLPANSVPLSIALGDINNDGFVDLFVSCMAKAGIVQSTLLNGNTTHASSLLLLNNGKHQFIDITESANLSYNNNAFTALFANLDDDQWLDLVVAYSNGNVKTYKNLQGSKFQDIENPTSNTVSNPMSIAASDVNQDGRLDLFFTNTGNTIPDIFLQLGIKEGQTVDTKWVLLRNDGNFQFTDIADEVLLADYELAHGAVFEDFNLDGLMDIVTTGNDIHFPAHWLLRSAGRLLIQEPNGTFAPAEKLAFLSNRHFGVTPLVVDINDDGYPDIIYSNLNGPAKAFINNGGSQQYIKVIIDDTAAAIGAKIMLATNDGTDYTRYLVNHEGLAADQSHAVTFSLKQHTGIDSIIVEYVSGKTVFRGNPELNQTLLIKDILSQPAANSYLLPPPKPPTRQPTAPTEQQQAAPPGQPEPEQQPKATSFEDELNRLLTE